MSDLDYEFRREAQAEYRRQMYEDLAGTYDRNPLSPRGQAIQDARDAGVSEADFINSEEGEE